MIGQAISLTFALLGAAAVYGTDVFFCVVGRTALTHVSDAALVETMGRLHEVAGARGADRGLRSRPPHPEEGITEATPIAHHQPTDPFAAPVAGAVRGLASETFFAASPPVAKRLLPFVTFVALAGLLYGSEGIGLSGILQSVQ